MLAKLEELHLTPQPEAGRHTLIRRVSAGITGLPPSPREIARFTSDTSPRAYEDLVDRLLSDDHFGERWARHWLDAVRFGESDGILTVNEDKVRSNAWPLSRCGDSSVQRRPPLRSASFVINSWHRPAGEAAADYRELRQFIHLGTRLQNNADPNDKQFHRAR